MKLRCQICGGEVEAVRARNSPEWLQGFCERCGTWVKAKVMRCRRCRGFTYHQPVNQEGDFLRYRCVECGSEKLAYMGPRAPYQRSRMPV